MRTVCIIGTDWEGAHSSWPQQPAHSLDRRKREDWDYVFHQLGNVARVDSIAVGIRGVQDWSAVASLPTARAAYDASMIKPTLMPWLDTGALSDVASGPSGIDQKFDFANPQHIEWGWEKFAKVFFDHFASATLERTANGRVLCSWWHINSDNGRGIINQHLAQKLLDRVDTGLTDMGLGPADHLVDEGWRHFAPSLRVWGLHSWFDAWSTPPKSYTLRTHGVVTAGVCVPSFTNPNDHVDKIPLEPHGAVLARGLKACRDAHATVVLLEGGTDYQEGAAILPHLNPDGSTYHDNIARLRDHIALTTGITEPEPTPIPGGLMHLAISAEPILTWKTGLLVPSPLAPNRYAMRWTQVHGQPGHPDPNSTLFMCLNPDGTTEAKPHIDEWESSQPVAPGDKEICWFTQNAEKTQSSTIVYGLQQFAL